MTWGSRLMTGAGTRRRIGGKLPDHLTRNRHSGRTPCDGSQFSPACSSPCQTGAHDKKTQDETASAAGAARGRCAAQGGLGHLSATGPQPPDGTDRSRRPGGKDRLVLPATQGHGRTPLEDRQHQEGFRFEASQAQSADRGHLRRRRRPDISPAGGATARGGHRSEGIEGRCVNRPRGGRPWRAGTLLVRSGGFARRRNGAIAVAVTC